MTTGGALLEHALRRLITVVSHVVAWVWRQWRSCTPQKPHNHAETLCAEEPLIAKFGRKRHRDVVSGAVAFLSWAS